MSFEDIRDCYLALPHVSEGFPFDEHTLVVKVGSKMFAYLALDEDEPYLALKCEPERGAWLCQHYSAIEPAYHMNKRHWIGIRLAQGIEAKLVRSLVEQSYQLVWAKLTKRERSALQTS